MLLKCIKTYDNKDIWVLRTDSESYEPELEINLSLYREHNEASRPFD